MRIALVTSMKFGLTQFIMRDVEGLMARGADVRLFTLSRERGLYEPRPDWEGNEASGRRAVAGLLRFLVTRHERLEGLPTSTRHRRSTVQLRPL